MHAGVKTTLPSKLLHILYFVRSLVLELQVLKRLVTY
jgi:hypothetical protein